MTVVLLVVSAGAMSACAKREAADLVLKNGVV
jgi:hypothetical protein